MTTGVACPQPILQFFAGNGTPLSGGSVLTQVGNVNAATYSDINLTQALPNPIPLNSRGEVSTATGVSSQLFLTPNQVYVFTISDKNGNQINQAQYLNGVQLSGEAAAAALNGVTDTAILNSLLRTAAEISAGVTPTNYAYLEGDPRRYGGDPTGVSVSTTAVQAAINVAKSGSGAVLIGTNCNFLVGALSVTLASSSGTTGLRISGSSMGGSRLTQSGTPATLLTVAGPTPTGAPSQSQFVMENLSIIGSSTAGDGVLLQGLAWWELRNVFIVGFGKNLNLSSALTGRIEGGALNGGLTGMYSRPDTTSGAACNLIRLRDVTIEGNTSWGVDIDGISGGAGATLLVMDGCDLETNGTALNYSTGALHVGAHVAGTLGYSLVSVARTWFEANDGQTIQIDTQASGQLFVSIRDSLTLSEDAGHSINAPSLQSIEIANTFSPSPNATWTLDASVSKLTNTLVYTLTDSSSQQVYDNAATHSGPVFSAQQAAPYVYKGSTASTASGTAVTVVTLPSSANISTYIVSGTVPNLNNASNYSAVAVAVVNGTAANITTLQSGADISISMAFLQVQLTQTSGSSQVMQYSIFKVA